MDSNFNGGKVREAYKLIKQLKGGFRAVTRAVKDTSGKLLLEEKQISARWTEYIEELYTDKNTYEEGILEELERRSAENEEENCNDGILKSEVEKATKMLKNNKSCGIDGTPAEIIKAGGSKIVDKVWEVCREIWESESWPDDWCKSIVVTIPKKGDLTECSNYRTIALIPHACKVVLNIVLHSERSDNRKLE